MVKWGLIILAAVSSALIVTVVTISASYWNQASKTLERSDAFEGAPTGSLSTSEIAISMVIFGEDSQGESWPCPTLKRRFSSDRAGMRTVDLLARELNGDSYQGGTLGAAIGQLFLACKLETRHDKDAIVRALFNQLYFGAGEYGIDVASNSLFGKSVASLSIDQAMALAALIQSPNLRDQPEDWNMRKHVLLERYANMPESVLRADP